MNTQNLLAEAKELQDTLLSIRRDLHQHPEIGFDLPYTFDLVWKQLCDMGYEPQKCGKSGIVALVGPSEGKCILLRADMDALPLQECADIDYKSTTDGKMHGCGHDMHTAMLLGAAKLLKIHEADLSGTVKLVFQPAEEIFQGSQDMISSGVLENPKVDVAVMIHVVPGVPMPAGMIMVPAGGISMASCEQYHITVTGKGGHGSTPHNGGYGQGNNVGIRMATAPVILIMNPDVRLLMPIFKTATDAFLEDSRLAMYGMKQMLTESIPSSNSFCCAYTVNGYLQTLLTSLCNRLGIYIPRYMHFSGSCFFIRKKMFEEVGLFDESVFMYGEEEDIHYRLWTSGYRKMVYNGTLKYIHLVKDRKPDIAYEQKIIDVAVFQNSKKGIPAINTLRNRLRNNSLLIAREKLRIALGKKDHSLIDMLKELRLSIKEKISNAANG